MRRETKAMLITASVFAVPALIWFTPFVGWLVVLALCTWVLYRLILRLIP